MSWISDVLYRFAAWWCEEMSTFGAPPVDDETEREILEREREQLALTPWWL